MDYERDVVYLNKLWNENKVFGKFGNYGNAI